MTRTLFAVVALSLAHAAGAQSIGTMTSPETGAAAAGGGPVGVLLPSSIQSSSTAPIQPGHTITGDRPSKQQPMASAPQDQRLSRAEKAGPAPK